MLENRVATDLVRSSYNFFFKLYVDSLHNSSLKELKSHKTTDQPSNLPFKRQNSKIFEFNISIQTEMDM